MSPITINLTCWACPEAYEVYCCNEDGNEYLGYLKLRRGEFNVVNPHGLCIYRRYPKGDGLFAADERFTFLLAGVEAAITHRNQMGALRNREPLEIYWDQVEEGVRMQCDNQAALVAPGDDDLYAV